MGGQATYKGKTVEWKGETYTYHEAADLLGLCVVAFATRVRRWGVHDAMTVPPNVPRKTHKKNLEQAKKMSTGAIQAAVALSTKWR